MNGERASLEQAWAWLDRLSFPIATANVEPARAVGRALLMDLRTRSALPPCDEAALDGLAIYAADSEGAGPYNPVKLAAIPVAAGDMMPPGADAVLPADLIESGCALEQATPGEGVVQAGSQLAQGALLFPAGHVLRAQDVAVLSELSILTVVIRFGLTVAGEVGQKLIDLRQALLWRDACQWEARGDVILTTRSESGDIWDIQGVALRPCGDRLALGRRGGRPVVKLPDDFLGFTLGYEVLMARLLRGHAGLGLERTTVERPLIGRIVSAIGLTDIVLVRVGEGVTPLVRLETGGAAALARADGYVLVPAMREGFAPGEIVRVHCFAA